MKNEMAWATVGRHAAQGVAWALCDIEMCERIEALEAKLATAAPCPGESVATDFGGEASSPDYESWVGDLVMHSLFEKPGVLDAIEQSKFGWVDGTLYWLRELRLATDSERRLYTGTPPTEAGQWCMVRSTSDQKWLGLYEFITTTKDGTRFICHDDDWNGVMLAEFARLATPAELRQAGKDGAE